MVQPAPGTWDNGGGVSVDAGTQGKAELEGAHPAVGMIAQSRREGTQQRFRRLIWQQGAGRVGGDGALLITQACVFPSGALSTNLSPAVVGGLGWSLLLPSHPCQGGQRQQRILKVAGAGLEACKVGRPSPHPGPIEEQMRQKEGVSSVG